jgi:hypothetical protein
VAHIFHLPFTFEFRKLPVEWELRQVRIVGWEKNEDDSPIYDRLAARVEDERGSQSVSLPLERLPPPEWDMSVAAFEKNPEDDSAVERVCSHFRPYMFVSLNNGRYLSLAETTGKNMDPWLLRDDLLRLNDEFDNALAFLNRWGRWGRESCVTLSDLKRTQASVRTALTRSSAPPAWFGAIPTFPQVWSSTPEYPYLKFITDDAQIAVRMAVHLDVLRRLKFKICARPDCALPFQLSSKHRRKYCSQYCAHLESVRRNRKHRRKGKS